MKKRTKKKTGKKKVARAKSRPTVTKVAAGPRTIDAQKALLAEREPELRQFILKTLMSTKYVLTFETLDLNGQPLTGVFVDPNQYRSISDHLGMLDYAKTQLLRRVTNE